MKDAVRKLSKRHGDPTYEDLLEMGYLREAVLNYVALLGWSPGGEREIYSLPELEEVFDVSGISKSPAIFDIEKLNWLNGEYIRALTPDKFLEAALPHIRAAVKNPLIDPALIAPLLQQRCEKLTDIPKQIDFFDALPEYSSEIFIHKKSKTDESVSLLMLREALPVLKALPEWELAAIHDALFGLVSKLGVKNSQLLWPIRIAISGREVTPGGAVEICRILGRDETVKRIEDGIKRLS
jgi:glutamyl-tRNA synthetase